MAKFSANGKRMGRPPKAKPETATPQEVAVGRAVSKFLARYDAAGKGRRMVGWNAPSSGPNRAIEGLQTLRDRSSDAVRNDWSGESLIQKWATTLVGVAITPRFNRINSKERRQEVNDILADFVKQADADCVLDLYGMQTLAVRSWLERGEMFGRRRYRRTDDGLRVPMQVQMLEADMVPLFDATTYPGLIKRNEIRSGIEFDTRGKRVAFWVFKRHPGDNYVGNSSAPAAADLVRVPAEDMFHLFEPKRIGQLRGVPILAPILARLRGIDDYEDATLERQKLANLFVAFISRTLPPVDPTDPNADPLSGLEATLDDAGSPLVPMKPGLLQELDDGQTVTFANPPDPATNYSEYMRTSHLGTAAGVGMPYELFSGDLAGVSDRALRVLMNELRRFAAQRQWQIIIPQMCQKVIEWFGDAALVTGLITFEERDAVTRCQHSPHGFEYIHPVQDVQGKALEVQNGFRSRSSVVGQKGDDPDMVDQERADDMAREETLGLPITGLPAGMAQPGEEAAVEQQAAEKKTAAEEAQARTQWFRAQANATARPPDPTPAPQPVDPMQLTIHNHQPAVSMTNNLPEPGVTIENNVSPTPVNVVNEVQPTNVVVENNVAPPLVNVVNEVQPNDVNVHLPARQTSSTVKYNSKGEITSVQQIETDVDGGE